MRRGEKEVDLCKKVSDGFLSRDSAWSSGSISVKDGGPALKFLEFS